MSERGGIANLIEFDMIIVTDKEMQFLSFTHMYKILGLIFLSFTTIMNFYSNFFFLGSLMCVIKKSDLLTYSK